MPSTTTLRPPNHQTSPPLHSSSSPLQHIIVLHHGYHHDPPWTHPLFFIFSSISPIFLLSDQTFLLVKYFHHTPLSSHRRTTTEPPHRHRHHRWWPLSFSFLLSISFVTKHIYSLPLFNYSRLFDQRFCAIIVPSFFSYQNKCKCGCSKKTPLFEKLYSLVEWYKALYGFVFYFVNFESYDSNSISCQHEGLNNQHLKNH